MSMSITASGNGNIQGFEPSRMATKIASKMMSDLDPNNSGSVTKETFISTLTAKGISSADATKIYDSIDTNKTGSITKSDIESAIKSGSLKPPAGGPPGGAGSPQGSGSAEGPGKNGGMDGAKQAGSSATSKTYEAADTNQDGTVSAVEALLYSLKSESPENKPAKDALGKNIDTSA
ncbi:EF-hand domain-containing protein [Undibacterium sp. Ji22W]|uniref:EF-hand domain-containing protein n=1 Tax=Undibacterium sp. Ji22W TaxID=3413038 RepID=UPI003BF3B024